VSVGVSPAFNPTYRINHLRLIERFAYCQIAVAVYIFVRLAETKRIYLVVDWTALQLARLNINIIDRSDRVVMDGGIAPSAPETHTVHTRHIFEKKKGCRFLRYG
jgi:hypothetical protein